MRGRIFKTVPERGYGFVVGEDGETALISLRTYVNKKSIELEIGTEVEYDAVKNDRGFRAKNVTIPEKTILQAANSPYERNKAIPHDTEDKGYWCHKGMNIEDAFIGEMVPIINRSLIVHPKKKENVTFIDFLNTETGDVADLKTQRTPFFTSKKYGCDPQYTVTFNAKDYRNYKQNYPNSTIYFWVNWEQLSWGTMTVGEMHGVWEVPFMYIQKMIESGEVPLHTYLGRVGDRLNAKDSYLLDLRQFARLC